MTLALAIKKRLKGFELDLTFETGGGRLGILGASGSGKSMTLKSVAGIVTPDRGRILLNGRVLFDSSASVDVPPQQRRVGYLFQNYALFPHMTAIDNIACGRNLAKAEARRDPRIRELLGLLRLTELAERYPGQLSGGQQQRVALARILRSEPEIILLDEPFSALDEYLREQLHFQLAELLSNWGDNVLMVTHNRDEVYKLCDQLLVLDKGRIAAAGPLKQLFAEPGRLPVARLTGCKNISPVKRLAAYEVEAAAWGLRLRTAAPVAGDIVAVGIRAHDLRPAAAGDPNAFPCQVADRGEGPFEHNIICRTPGPDPLWWKVAKENLPGTLPASLSLPPEKLLLLRE